jgi:hypothetical protein
MQLCAGAAKRVKQIILLFRELLFDIPAMPMPLAKKVVHLGLALDLCLEAEEVESAAYLMGTICLHLLPWLKENKEAAKMEAFEELLNLLSQTMGAHDPGRQLMGMN